MEIDRITLKYCGKLTVEVKNRIYCFLENSGFEPFAISEIHHNDGSGELKYFIKCENSLRSRLEGCLKELGSPIEISIETGFQK